MGRIRRSLAPGEINEERAEQLGICVDNYVHFIHNYCKIYDSISSEWIPFRLWKEQRELLHTIHGNQLTVILKARQLGISWLTLSYALWQVMFRPIAAVSIFSRRETEALYLIGQDRLRGMFNELPAWMKTGHTSVVNSGREWALSTKSAVRAFPTSAGDSYVSTLAIVDEADLSPDLNMLMGAVKPTIDNGGKMVLLSRVNKSEPESEFKAIYRGAVNGENGWVPVFLPWHVNPHRDADWYERQRKDILSRTGALDDLYEQYPATDVEALSEKTLDKRIPPMWLGMCFEPMASILPKGSPSIPGLDIYKAPIPGARYVMGADPAEGNVNSDDSSLTVVDMESGEEQALLAGKFEPAVFSSYIAMVSAYYNYAPALVERNNHGHSVIQWLEEHARRTRLLLGHDAETHKRDRKNRAKRKAMKKGWLSSTLGKTILYTNCTEFIRTSANVDNPEVGSKKVIHSRSTHDQLASIESATLSAPQGRHDDRADSFALAQTGRKQIADIGKGAVLAVTGGKGWGL